MQKNGHSTSTLQIYSQVQCLELPLIALKQITKPELESTKCFGKK